MRCVVALSLLALPLFADDTMTEYYPERTQTMVEQALEKNCSKVLCGRIKIKEGCVTEVRKWFKTLQERQNELIEAFTVEGVWLESVFLEHTKDADYLVYYMRQDDIEKVYEQLAKYQMPVRLFHIECCKNYLDECVVLDPLFDLQRTQ
jgi:hypothetical protein